MKEPFDEPTLRGDTQSRYYSGRKVFGGRFLLDRRIGRGGMGEVWLARDTELSQERALKFLPPEIATDERAIGQLRREAKAGMELAHPRIVRTNDFHVQPDDSAVVMEYVEGKTLSGVQAATPCGFLEVGVIQPWIEDMIEALRYAHGEMGRVHRDIKPQNVIVENETDRAKLMDFGISRRISDTHSMVTGADNSGTLAYSSPQQVMGDAPAATDDIYSLAATIYDLLTGAPPFFRGDLRMQVQKAVPPTMAARRKELLESGGIDGPGDEIPEVWEKVVATCLAKEPGKRPATVGDFAKLLNGKAVLPEGKTVVERPVVTKPVPPVPEPPMIPEPPVMPEPPEGKTGPLPPRPEPEPEPSGGGGKSRAGLMVLVGVLGVAVVGLGSFVATLMVNNRGDTPPPIIPKVPLVQGEPDPPKTTPDPPRVAPDPPKTDPDPPKTPVVQTPPKRPSRNDLTRIAEDVSKSFVMAGNSRGNDQRDRYFADRLLYGGRQTSRTSAVAVARSHRNTWRERGYEPGQVTVSLSGSGESADVTVWMDVRETNRDRVVTYRSRNRMGWDLSDPKKPLLTEWSELEKQGFNVEFRDGTPWVGGATEKEVKNSIARVAVRYYEAGSSDTELDQLKMLGSKVTYFDELLSRDQITAKLETYRSEWPDRKFAPDKQVPVELEAGRLAIVQVWFNMTLRNALRNPTEEATGRMLGGVRVAWDEDGRARIVWVKTLNDDDYKRRSINGGVPTTTTVRLPALGKGKSGYMATRDARAAVWNNSYQPEDGVSWSGATMMTGGVPYATGEGTVSWYKNGAFRYSYAGTMVRGKLDGKVRNRDADGSERDVWYDNGQKLKGPPRGGGGGGFPFATLRKGDGGFMFAREGRVAVWNNSYQAEDSVSWSGTSVTSNGVAYASGQGTVSWYKNDDYQYSYTGTMVRGKLNGFVTTVDKGGSRGEGRYLNGKKTGVWSYRDPRTGRTWTKSN